jgi:hypothetical protein
VKASSKLVSWRDFNLQKKKIGLKYQTGLQLRKNWLMMMMMMMMMITWTSIRIGKESGKK